MQATASNILLFLKIMDSIALPLLVIPFLQFAIKIKHIKFSFIDLLPVTFLLFSFSALVLIGDLQKNCFSLLWLMYFIYHLYAFYEIRKIKSLVYTGFFMLMCALTHFGTAAIAILFALIITIVFGKRKHILYAIVGVSGIIIITAIFDYSRFIRILNIVQVIFEKPLFLQPLHFPDLIQIVFSLLLIILSFVCIRLAINDISKSKYNFLSGILILQLILVLPIYDGEYYKRFSLFLFIFQALTLAVIAGLKASTLKKMLILLCAIFILFSISGYLKNPKTPTLTDEAYKSLLTLHSKINNNKDKIIIARHGLEWWTGLALHTPIGQDKAIDPSMLDKYDTLFFLIQKSGYYTCSVPLNHPFHEPAIPPHGILVQKNDYFELWMLPLVKHN